MNNPVDVSSLVVCPVCAKSVPSKLINSHLDMNCNNIQTSFSTPNTEKKNNNSTSKKRKNYELQYNNTDNTNNNIPLSTKMRPANIDEFLDQPQLIEFLRPILSNNNMKTPQSIPSLILYGPPGCGKTSAIKILIKPDYIRNAKVLFFSAVEYSSSDVKKFLGDCLSKKNSPFASKTIPNQIILVIDEIHCWNKSHQAFLLPFLESGRCILLGATTENPSFNCNSALLSRCSVLKLNPVSTNLICQLLNKAIVSENGLGKENISCSSDVISGIAELSNGDCRIALNTLQMAFEIASSKSSNKNNMIPITLNEVKLAFQKGSSHLYDKKGDYHYDMISALHKSMRYSDQDASIYYLGRMLEAGEDPLFVARRVIRAASEDVGLAEPQALVQAIAAYQACTFIGKPECNLALAQAVTFIARAPKSRELDEAYASVREIINTKTNGEVPLYLRNAPTELMKQFGYSKNIEGKTNNLPDNIAGTKFFK